MIKTKEEYDRIVRLTCRSFVSLLPFNRLTLVVSFISLLSFIHLTRRSFVSLLSFVVRLTFSSFISLSHHSHSHSSHSLVRLTCWSHTLSFIIIITMRIILVQCFLMLWDILQIFSSFMLQLVFQFQVVIVWQLGDSVTRNGITQGVTRNGLIHHAHFISGKM